MQAQIQMVKFKGTDAVEMRAGNYYAVVVPTLGSNVMRLRDESRNIEVFRYIEDLTIPQFMMAPEIYGLPTLYLPNRLDGGVLKTSDDVYNLPVNELRFKNHLHGFVHKRSHKIKEMKADTEKCVLVTEYVYDENDFFYACFPVKFTMNIKFTLSSKGLEHEVTLKNDSKKALPVSIATHTTYNAPFIKNGNQENVRLRVPAIAKVQFNKRRWIPNGRKLNLNNYDREYVSGTKCPVHTDICNDMYYTGETELEGKKFRGTVMTDAVSGKSICNEIDENYKFWVIWNDKGFKNYFCAEPMTAQVNAPNLDIPVEMSGYQELAENETYTVWQRFFCVG